MFHGFYVKPTGYGFSVIEVNDVGEMQEFAVFNDGAVVDMGNEPFDLSFVQARGLFAKINKTAKIMGYEKATSITDMAFCALVVTAHREGKNLDIVTYRAPQTEETEAEQTVYYIKSDALPLS